MGRGGVAGGVGDLDGEGGRGGWYVGLGGEGLGVGLWGWGGGGSVGA